MSVYQIFDAISDDDGERKYLPPGVDIFEFVKLDGCPFDEIDRIYVDAETIGGG